MKILFVTSTRIGDAILSTGLLNKVISDYPLSQVTVACGPAAAPLFKALPNLKRIIILDKMLFSLHWLRLWVLCIPFFWDLVIDLRNAPVTFLLFRYSRKGMPRETKLQRRVETLSEVLNLDFIPAPKLWTNNLSENLARELIPNDGPVLAVGPTANWRAKTWRADYFLELIDRITGPRGILPGAKVAIFGRDEERPMTLRLIGGIKEGLCIDLVGKLDLLSVYACFSRCSLYVGNDSGLMHLAAAAGLPTLGLFGPTQESIYAPWGNHTGFVRTKADFDEIFPKNFDHRESDSLMDSLTVDMAEEGAKQLWEKVNGSKL